LQERYALNHRQDCTISLEYTFRVLFKNAASLSTELCEARDNYQLGKLERTISKADLLILDELSYLSFNRNQSELLFKVISERSEKAAQLLQRTCLFHIGQNCLRIRQWLLRRLTA
jgi:DNA replication protein DnaC